MPRDDMARLAANLVGETGHIVDVVLPKVRAEMNVSRPDAPIGDDDLRNSITAVVSEILSILQGHPPSVATPIEDVVRRRFAQGVSLLHLLHGYRVCAASVWDRLATVVGDDPEDRDALLHATRDTFEMVDQFSLRAQEIYRQLSAGNIRRQEQIRAARLDTLMSGEGTHGADFWNAAAVLGVPRQGHFVVVDVVAASEAATATDWEELAGEDIPVTSSWFRLGLSSQAGLICFRTTNDGADLAAFISGRVHSTVGLSAPFTAVTDCRQARAEAAVAAAATSPDRPVVRYGHDVLEVLMASAPLAADSLIATTLGPVLELPSQQATPLIETVRAWLDTGQSIAATAKTLYCHRNTVNNRLKRFEMVTGRSLRDNVWLAQVILAVNGVSTAQRGRG